MLRPDLFDRYDMERRIHERLFCFGSDSADNDSGGGSDPAPDDTQANYEREAFGDSRDGVNFRSAPSQPRESDSSPAQALAAVTGINPTLVEMAQSATPAQRAANAAANEQQFQEFIANEAMNQAIADNIRQNEMARVQQMSQNAGEVFFDERTGQYMPGALPDTQLGVGMGGQGSITSRVPLRVSPSYFGDLAVGAELLPSNVADVSVSGSNLPGATITDESGTTFDTTTGEIIQSFAGDQDDTDPFAGTGRTAMDLLNYDLDDQSGPAGRIRPFSGLTRAQQADLEARDDFVAQRILDAQTAQPSGIPTTNLTGIYTVGNDPMGDVRGFTDFGPELPFLGPTQVYTGFGDNPFAPPEVQDERQTTPPVTNPLTGTSRCPDGFIFDDDLQACRRKTRSELADTGSGGSPAPSTGDIFYRRSILDDAPANLPAGFDFNAANRRFIESYGVRPDNYRMPLSLTGFTRL